MNVPADGVLAMAGAFHGWVKSSCFVGLYTSSGIGFVWFMSDLGEHVAGGFSTKA